MIEVKLTFATHEEVIVAMAKLSKPLPAAKPKADQVVTAEARADKDVKRGRGRPRKETTAVPDAGVTPALAPAVAAQAAVTAVVSPESTAPAAKEAAPSAAVSPTAAPVAVDHPALEKAQAAIEKLFNAKGAQAAMGTLASHGVQRVRDLAPENRAAFIADVEARLTS